MQYTLIKGDFYIVGHSPDGDSLKFKANNPARWESIEQTNPDSFKQNLTKEDGVLMLRLEGIDALETHYSPPPLPTPPDLRSRSLNHPEKPKPSNHHQPPEFADKATMALLTMFGIQRVEWRRWGVNEWIDKIYIKKRGREVCLSEKYSDGFSGYIITREAERNGRPVAWIFEGYSPIRDGSSMEAAEVAAIIEQSINYKLLQQGLVYPYFFMTLPGILRDKLAQVSQAAYTAAQRGAANLWQADDSLDGFRVGGVHLLHENNVLYPYLFRRMIRHWYHTNLQQYWQAVRSRRTYRPADEIDLAGFFEMGNPYLFVISTQDFVRLEEVVYINGVKLQLTRPPFDLVFLG